MTQCKSSTNWHYLYHCLRSTRRKEARREGKERVGKTRERSMLRNKRLADGIYVFKYSGVQCLLWVSAQAAWACQWQMSCEVRDRDLFLQYLFKQKSCLCEAWKITAHLETFLPFWNVLVLFWNVFEAEYIKLKSSMHVAHLYSAIHDMLLVLFKFLSKTQNKLKVCTWSADDFFSGEVGFFVKRAIPSSFLLLWGFLPGNRFDGSRC